MFDRTIRTSGFIISPTGQPNEMKFEHVLYPDTLYGYLHFDFLSLVGFEVVNELPFEVVVALEKLGFDVRDAKDQLYADIDPKLDDEVWMRAVGAIGGDPHDYK